MHRYFIIYKPYLVLSQFTKENEQHRTLKDIFNVPDDVYAVGRLDNDSEGLLILTNDKQLTNRLLNPAFFHEREYWVQVEGLISEEAIRMIEAGVAINVNGKLYNTRPCKMKLFEEVPDVPERIPPIRHRVNVPTSWISITLTEGKNRQVKKITAKAGVPTLRLIRYRIEGLTIDGMAPGDINEISRDDIYRGLFKHPGSR